MCPSVFCAVAVCRYMCVCICVCVSSCLRAPHASTISCHIKFFQTLLLYVLLKCCLKIIIIIFGTNTVVIVVAVAAVAAGFAASGSDLRGSLYFSVRVCIRAPRKMKSRKTIPAMRKSRLVAGRWCVNLITSNIQFIRVVIIYLQYFYESDILELTTLEPHFIPFRMKMRDTR